MSFAKKISFCGIMAAIAVVIMLTAYFPYLTYAIPAIASVFILIPALELNIKYGWISYIAASVIVFLMCESEAKLLFIMFLGYYPIIKLLIDRMTVRPLVPIAKFFIFNAAAVAFYFVMTILFSIPADEYGMGFKYGIYVFWLIADVTFFIYDLGLSRLIAFYYSRYHDRISKMLR